MLFSRTIFAVVTSSISVSCVSALDLLIKDIQCESRPVTLQFEYVCNGEMLCTFGEIESMGGAFNYYGLVDQYNATEYDSIVVDANAYFYLTGYTHEQNLIENVAMPLCNNALEAGENNTYGECPNDGEYYFDTTYNMPAVDSEYVGWAASGWTGDIIINMYLNSTLVGKCDMNIETMVTGAYEAGTFRSMPSAKTVAFAVVGALAFLFVCCLCCCCRGKKRDEDVAYDASQPTGDYHRANKVGTYLL